MKSSIQRGSCCGFSGCSPSRQGLRAMLRGQQQEGGLPEGWAASNGQNRPLRVALTNFRPGFHCRSQSPDGSCVTGRGAPKWTREPSCAPRMQTRGAPVPTPRVAFRECSSQANRIVQLRYLRPSLTDWL